MRDSYLHVSVNYTEREVGLTLDCGEVLHLECV